MMKRVLALLLLIIFACYIAGCTDTENVPPVETILDSSTVNSNNAPYTETSLSDITTEGISRSNIISPTQLIDDGSIRPIETGDEAVFQGDGINHSDDDYTRPIEPIDETNIVEYVNQLCLTSRKWGTEDEERAVKYIESIMKSYGYDDIVRQEFPVYETDIAGFYNGFFDMKQGQSEPLGYSQNLIVTKLASIQTDDTFVISAHYDSIGGCLSAIDNASGTASVMEAARILQNQRLPFNVKFIFFGTEEYHLTGSRYYVSSLAETERDNILGCINVDMVGELGGGALEFRTASGHNVLTYLYKSIYPEKDLVGDYSGGTSDHISFIRVRIPAFMIIHNAPNYEYQRLESDLDFFDSKSCKEATQLIVDFMLSYDISKHMQLLAEMPVVGDLDVSTSFFTSSLFNFNKGALPGYKLSNAYQKLPSNGVTSEYICEYTNNDDGSYLIGQIMLGAPETDVTGYKKVSIDEVEESEYYLYSDEAKAILLYNRETGFLLRIEGQISEEEAVSVFQQMKQW